MSVERQPLWNDAKECSERIANLAVTALIDEAGLTPKPALVDRHSSGAHTDLDFGLMCRSAQVLRGTFAQIALAAFRQRPSQVLRERLAVIGRDGEKVMMAATGGTNTHRGAIWALGLLTAGAAMSGPGTSARQIAALAGEIARYPDRFSPEKRSSKGYRVRQYYGVPGAIGEARQGFPHVVDVALPALYAARSRGILEPFARLDALMAIIARLDDTCLLHRGGAEALMAAKDGARAVIVAGGTSTRSGWNALHRLDAELVARNASPGGSADLLAAALFLDSLDPVVQRDGTLARVIRP
ncbi:2-(5''-triphosphoribosyl)-3'-dephosphocoenzyme-A synthase [Marinithermofilum abyssi]|uniref:triphosphoribosyl-dephospho-CoA synthase n=1 Tax=Marinithermofilum abyssi TaxID=1571185 RepID=A0A8J2VDK5_9BACL|nr:triphosphoribosyl-dephospho-CoA synthase [Marinithermofilum abyssi]GGE12618.1 2-(5''-triphosphoribosyl)-3'-dephosphocoenzyme-A synthase [Marinithermofilum abyssi]